VSASRSGVNVTLVFLLNVYVAASRERRPPSPIAPCRPSRRRRGAGDVHGCARRFHATAVAIELKGGPQIDILLHEAKADGHHADDFVGTIVELDRAADCAPIATHLLPGR